MKSQKKKLQVVLAEHWKMTAYRRGTHQVEKVLEGHNLITDLLPNLLGNLFINKAGWATGASYFAIGTGTTTPAVTDTTLVTEVFRKALTSKTNVAGVCTLVSYMLFSECNYAIKEAGVFGHDADGTPDSGQLCSRWLVDFDNSAGLNDIQWEYELTIQRA